MPPLVRISFCGFIEASGEAATESKIAYPDAWLSAGSDVVWMPSPWSQDQTPERVMALTPRLHTELFDAETPPAEALRQTRLALQTSGASPKKALIHTIGFGGEPLR